jgi:methanol metabolism-related c-type cytochrome
MQVVPHTEPNEGERSNSPMLLANKGKRVERFLKVAVVGLGIVMSVSAAHANDPAPAADAAAPKAEAAPAAAAAETPGAKPKVDPATQQGKSLDGATWNGMRWAKENGEPSYRISEDGTIDWASYEGFKRYHSECHVCHGPNGLGSTFAPALAESLKTMTYDQFKEVVSSGRVVPGGVMPAFASNPNVMCYVDDLYTYLKGRADGALKSGQAHVKKRVPKTKETQEYEKSCME